MKTLNLTPSSNSLEGIYTKDSTVLCFCDATDSDLTVYLPDAEDVVFKFKKINDANKIYLRSRFNKIDNSEFVTLENENECKTLEYDGNNWWITSSH